MYIGILALVALVSLMGLVCVSCGCQVLRDEGSLVKAWSSLHYLLLVMSPTFQGDFGLVSETWARAGQLAASRFLNQILI